MAACVLPSNIRLANLRARWDSDSDCLGRVFGKCCLDSLLKASLKGSSKLLQFGSMMGLLEVVRGW